ncbi:unnamed protein product [Urochloa decumbens]|uniref:DUF1618 domain-containing protein n=2 Tax=Urochloa decumbens TaxID=240449 RepID=A0ABC9AHI9_9POAL
MPFGWHLVRLQDGSLRPPVLDDDNAEGEGEIPWVLLEDRAYVADRRNATTATSDSNRFGAEIQVTFCSARPPRVSYLCVFCSRRPADAKEAEVIAMEPKVLFTDANLVLLRIYLSPDRDQIFESDLYVYRPAGDGGPSLTLLERPPGDRIFQISQVGILSSHTNCSDKSSGLSSLRPHRAPEDSYIVAALCRDQWLEGGQFLLYLYDSKLKSWTVYTVSVEDQQFQHQEGAYFLHNTSKVIAIGGKDGTVGFVDLWRGILLCDLLLVKDVPRLRYIKVPPPLRDAEIHGDGRLSRDIAVIEDRIRYVQQKTFWKPCPLYVDEYNPVGWMASTWSRLITSPVDDPWETQHTIKSSEMDISNSQFELLPKMHDNAGRPLPPFEMLNICQPTLSLRAGDASICFMVKINFDDDEAWVIDVDMSNNKLQGVTEFDATRSACFVSAYMHSGISKYLKKASVLQRIPAKQWTNGHKTLSRDSSQQHTSMCG